MSKWRVFTDINWGQPFASFGEPEPSNGEDDHCGDYMIFGTLEEANAFIEDPSNYPDTHWRNGEEDKDNIRARDDN